MQIFITFLDEEYLVTFDYTVTSKGHPGVAPSLSYPGDPPEPMEFEITVEYLMDKNGVDLIAPNWLKKQLETYLYKNSEMYDKVYEMVEEAYLAPEDEPRD
jgi:hypothetical protein